MKGTFTFYFDDKLPAECDYHYEPEDVGFNGDVALWTVEINGIDILEFLSQKTIIEIERKIWESSND